jgi:3-isopropylmalate dehydratase small subunit
LNGLDDIDLTMQYEDEIAAHEAALKQDIPWLSAKA